MLTEGFLATLVILACVAGLGMGLSVDANDGFHVFRSLEGRQASVTFGDDSHLIEPGTAEAVVHPSGELVSSPTGLFISPRGDEAALVGQAAWNTRYSSWTAAGSLGAKVGAFVDGAGNFLAAMGIPVGVGIALMGVLVASFAGTTLDTACRLQRYIVQELAATALPARPSRGCIHCGYDLTGNVSGTCPECGWEIDWSAVDQQRAATVRERPAGPGSTSDATTPPLRSGLVNPIAWLTNKHVATIAALLIGGFIAALPSPNADAWTWATAGSGGLILWPLFGATNQLLGGLAFLVIGFYLWRRSKPVWFLLPPLVFMLIMPAWALLWQMFVEAPGAETGWWQDGRWILLAIGLATLALEIWTIVEAVLLWPRVKGVLEDQLPGGEFDPALQPATA